MMDRMMDTQPMLRPYPDLCRARGNVIGIRRGRRRREENLEQPVRLVFDEPTCRGDVLEEPMPAGDAGHKVVYRGLLGQPGGQLVLVEEDGKATGPLPHVVKHSPSGFAWGYAGSGPAELARCLLIHALELEPDCEECGGTGAANGAPSPRGEGRRPCWWCDGGYTRPTPRQYQAFKDEVIARLPQAEEWELSRSEIRAWAAAHPAEEGDR